MSGDGGIDPGDVRARGKNRFRDIVQYAESFGGVWDFEFQQLRAAVCPGFCRYLSEGGAVVYEETYPARIGLRGAVADGLMGFVLSDGRGRRGRWQGGEAPADALAYAGPEKEIDVMLPEASENLVAVLPRARFLEVFERLSGGSASRALPRDHLLRRLGGGPRRRLAETWRGWVRGRPPLGTLAGGIAESVVRALEQEGWGELAGPTRSARLLFRRAMERCAGDGLQASPADLALELGVSLKSLELAFRACMGIPPARYLRRLRLNRVHERLLRSGPDEVTVGEVALDLGFRELGRFAGEYRRLFGELPSETLRRSGGSNPRLLPEE